MKETYSINFQDFTQFAEAHSLLKANRLLDEPVKKQQQTPQQPSFGQGYAKQAQGRNQPYPQTGRAPHGKQTNDFLPATDSQLNSLCYHLEVNDIDEQDFCRAHNVRQLSDLSKRECWKIIKDFTDRDM